MCHEQGSGVARDPVEAAKWYLLAAKGRNSAAVTNQNRLLPKLTSAEASEARIRAAAFVPHPSEQDRNN
jgi:TPR repeat protein